MIYHGLKEITCIETAISHIDGQNGKLIYRGYDVKELVQKQTFEETAYLLWYGSLPNSQQLHQLSEQFKSNRKLPTYVKKMIHSLPVNMDMMSVIRTTISSMGNNNMTWKPTIDQAITLTALMPSIIGYRKSVLENKSFDENAAKELNHVEYYLFMLTGAVPPKVHVEALETYMLLTLEHGLNASTFSARVTASTESDMVSSLTSAIGTMKGPLHGGAPMGVISLLDEIAASQSAIKVISEKVMNGERLMGFGHRVYKTKDPRAISLKKVLLQMLGEDQWLDLAIDIEETAISVLNKLKPGRSLYTNVEFYAAAIMKAIDMPPALFTPTFTASRVVGWTAHILEQSENNVLFRPQSHYTGETIKQ
ncbi:MULTISPECIES: citrate synthase/methylcitrate synthase [Virgibacillus]|uniref:citrate synthase/methylcitrate synthase n=1 Tax=Virgibacillus TaxID=84406 RepID=UPI00040F9BBA|nr:MULTISPECIES: citrate synthase/methylcitrate synthase [Bacillaceae]